MNRFSINIGAMDVTRRCQLLAPHIAAEWWYLAPENVCSDDGFLMVDNFDVQWDEPDPDGSITHRWATNETQLAIMLENRTFIDRAGAVQYDICLTPQGNGIDIEFTIRNIGRTILRSVTADFCLINHAFPIYPFLNPALFKQEIAPTWGGVSFQDCDSSHTWVYAGGRVVPASSMRILSPPKWVVEGSHAPASLLDFYNASEATEDPVDKPVICRSSRDGGWSIVYGWKRGFLVWQNPGLQCIHVDPEFGDIGVGEESGDIGAIRLVNAPPEEACEMLCTELNL